MITKRPKCFIKKCKRDGIMLFQDKLICGECFSKYQRMVRDIQKDLMEKI